MSDDAPELDVFDAEDDSKSDAAPDEGSPEFDAAAEEGRYYGSIPGSTERAAIANGWSAEQRAVMAGYPKKLAFMDARPERSEEFQLQEGDSRDEMHRAAGWI